jgi:PAS domain-containing protein
MLGAVANNRRPGASGHIDGVTSEVEGLGHLSEVGGRRARAANDFDGGLGSILDAADRMGTSIFRCSRDLRVIFANESYAELVGHPRELIVGQLMPQIVGEAAFRVMRPYVDRVLARERVEYEAEIPFAGTGLRCVHAVFIPGFDLRGSVCGWAAAIHPIRQRRPGVSHTACGASQNLPGRLGICLPLPTT